ncbi:hypothetical protein ACFPN7_36805 [Amycolatopsis halotolerans]|uniref:hypothetical protein n=1 Tax=Amycolatopsis halotolerans TaxID=330083 RepID=UPI0036237CA6
MAEGLPEADVWLGLREAAAATQGLRKTGMATGDCGTDLLAEGRYGIRGAIPIAQ